MKTLMDVNDVRQILAEEIEKLRNEETTASSLNAIVNATGKILSTVKMELEYAKLLGITPKIDFIEIQKQPKGQKKLKELKK